MLILPIRKKWFDMLLSGDKLEDYREIKRYWDIRIIKWLGYPLAEMASVKELLAKMETRAAREVIFQNGYGRNAPQLRALCSISIGTGKSEWGAVPETEYYRFHIKSISGKE